MYTQLLYLIHILLLLVNNVVDVHAVRMVDSLYCQCSAYDLVLILDDNKVFVFVKNALMAELALALSDCDRFVCSPMHTHTHQAVCMIQKHNVCQCLILPFGR